MEYQKVENWQEQPELKRLLGVKPKIESLYYRGKWNPKIFEKTVAIVGSRRISEYGKRVLEKMIPPLLLSKKTIISGFMYGTDQYAHNLAVEGGGKTIAVLGWGIKQMLDARDKILAEKIIKSGGLIISEWEDQLGSLWTFPVRNRIVAALSDEVIVTEAAHKSGSLITANWATKSGKPLFAVPGPVTSKVSEGTNELIASGQAKMWQNNNQDTSTKKQTIINDPIFKTLGDEGMTTSEVARKIGKPVGEVGAQLSLLALTGEIVERSGKYYIE
jgi:DNA processing protein